MSTHSPVSGEVVLPAVYDSGMITSPFSIGSYLWPGISKIIEESGELGKVLGKLMAYPRERYPDGSDLLGDLHEELADVIAAIEFFCTQNALDAEFISKRAIAKVHRFQHWQEGGIDALPVLKWEDR